MKSFSGFEAKKTGAAKEQLPAGGYVAQILDAKEVEYSWGNILLVSFDIAEGEHKGFFAADYKANDREEKKWRGTYRLRIPTDDGSEQDGWSKRSFGNAIWAVEASNPGFHWAWDETALKGKTVGVLFRNREWERDGRTGWFSECCALDSVDNIRNGKFRMPADKPLSAAQRQAAEAKNTYSASSFAEEDDLPF